MRSDTKTIVDAMRILARDIESDDGVANAAMLEAELYEHVSEEASDSHENIRETIRKAKGGAHA